jgi:hypothetical protein
VIFFELIIQLDVTSDGANNVTTDWTVSLANPLLGALGDDAMLGALSINAVASNASGGPIPSGLDPSAVGQLLGPFYLGPSGPLQIASPAAITQGAATLTPTGGPGSSVNINWDGTFTLRLDLPIGPPVLTFVESVCVFDAPGSGVDFTAN